MDGEKSKPRYYKKPRYMIEDPHFWPIKRKIGPIGEDIYVILLERLELSKKNGEKWKDEKGEIFVYAKQEELAEKMGVSVSTIARAFRNLQSVGLIEVKKSGNGKPARIYVHEFLEECAGNIGDSETDDNDNGKGEDNMTPNERLKRNYKKLRIPEPEWLKKMT